MTLAWAFGYFGTALLYAALAAALVGAGPAALARLAGRPALVAAFRRRVLPAFTAFVLVFLALHPFPNAVIMTCPQADTQAQLRPLGFGARYLEMVRNDVPPLARLRDLTISSSIMNLVVCMGFGSALAWAGFRPLAATCAGLALSLSVETAQLTALFGIYPCPYRQFDVDDLILNTAGTLLGAALAGALLHRHRGRRAGGP